jgi:hypothetical protein
VRWQALALAGLLVAAAVLASPPAALVLSVVSGVIARGLYVKYRRDVVAAGTATPRHRERLDLIVAGDARAALGVGVIAGAILVGLDVDAVDIGAATATPVLVAAAVAGVYLSSLVDWYIILPRISGQLGVRPCRDHNGQHPRFPKTWRETTRWWYNHRIAAALILSFGLSFAVTSTIKQYVSVPGGAFVVATVAVAGFASYRKAAFRAFFEAGHPTFIVGRTVHRSRAKRRPLRSFKLGGRTFTIRGLRKEAVGPLGPREYVYDVSLECVQLVAVRDRERAIPRDENGDVIYEDDPEKVLLKDIGAAKRAKPFEGCTKSCSGVNWYCIENTRCFEPK